MKDDAIYLGVQYPARSLDMFAVVSFSAHAAWWMRTAADGSMIRDGGENGPAVGDLQRKVETRLSRATMCEYVERRPGRL